MLWTRKKLNLCCPYNSCNVVLFCCLFNALELGVLIRLLLINKTRDMYSPFFTHLNDKLGTGVSVYCAANYSRIHMLTSIGEIQERGGGRLADWLAGCFGSSFFTSLQYIYLLFPNNSSSNTLSLAETLETRLKQYFHGSGRCQLVKMYFYVKLKGGFLLINILFFFL